MSDPLTRTVQEAAAAVNGNGHVELEAIQGDLNVIRRTRWAWTGWAALGSFLLPAGEPGAGKGVVICWLLAKLTRGEMPGDLQGVPANILWVGQEDSWEEVVLPRLAAAGADLDRVFNLKVTTPGQFLDVARDRQALGDLVDQHDIRVIAFEAIVDHLTGDDHKNAEVRRALMPVVDLAREKQLLVIGITHLNKETRGSYRHRVSGSGGYLAVARIGWLVHRHPDDPELRVLAFGKGNLGKVPDSMVFAIEGTDVPNPSNDEIANVGRIATDPEPYLDGSLGVDEVLAGPAADHHSLEEDVKRFLSNLLVDGPVRSPDVYAAGEKVGLQEKTLLRHKGAAGVHAVRREDGWWWEAT